MIHFKTLRLSGFKSFVDKTELKIGTGLNGIVGPNGCGKSNLVEALRWVMGENSAKRMRGGGMEDVIFNGTDQRSARNLAEVSLMLDNSARTAPAAYNNADEIEVTRKIERDKGSTYKINGKTVRARDVQMLFSDTITGANSPALVSQGQVSKIINAKPQERRLILEESAGISGLYARRHEAELRLRAANQNLARVQDLLDSMEGRLTVLKRQARMAVRYKEINGKIREYEMALLYARWVYDVARMRAFEQEFSVCDTAIADKLGAVTQLTKTIATLQEDIPALRKAEMDAAAALQTKTIQLQQIDDAEARQKENIKQLEQAVQTNAADLEHEQQSVAEATSQVDKLEQEKKEITDSEGEHEAKLKNLEEAKNKAEQDVAVLEEKYAAIIKETAESEARKNNLEQQITRDNERINVLQARLEEAKEAVDALQKDDAADIKIDLSALEKALLSLEKKFQDNQKKLEDKESELEKIKSDFHTLQLRKSEIGSEVSTLKEFLKAQDNGDFAVVRDKVVAKEGFEKAVSRALGDSLTASIDEGAPQRWQKAKKSASDLQKLPEGLTALSTQVDVPQELQNALSQIGYVEKEEDGHALWQELQVGQSIVSREGTYWRWDGYFVDAQVKDKNAASLEYKNKLKTLEKRQAELSKAAQKTADAQQELQEEVDELKSQGTELQDNVKAATQEYHVAKDTVAEHKEKILRKDADVSRQKSIIETAQSDITALEKSVAIHEKQLEALIEAQDSKGSAEDRESVAQNLKENKEIYHNAVREHDAFLSFANRQKARFHAISDEYIANNNRLIRSKDRVKTLSERLEKLRAELSEAKAAQKSDPANRENLLSDISKLEQARDVAAENLAARETDVQSSQKDLRDVEIEMSDLREKRASVQANVTNIKEQIAEIVLAAEEKFDAKPSSLLPQLSGRFDFDNVDNDFLEDIKSRQSEAVIAREKIGPVNLRAEIEAEELEKEVGGLLEDRNDLTAAIEELQEGINTINNEAKERLSVAFQHVNAHFQRLFLTLFGGGKAHLALTEGEDNKVDPLTAGLEIFAQPPGKTLQSLSLLSGGEQTLASIALIFAMFLTNPSPICVLDEIDAPLDDANVEKVCNMLEQITDQGTTRFVIITHHRLTMARMDRLYGVTMSEKGVSQLVSVDLQESFDFLEAA